jgi:hypothetical protein
VNSISLASSIAMAVGLAAALPQIIRMLAARSALGQSIVGWGMGLVANGAMAYVNLAGFHAQFLAASNALSGALCIAAMGLIARFQGEAADAAEDRSAEARAARDARIAGIQPAPVRRPTYVAPSHHTLADMPTMELVALRTALEQADAVRASRREREYQAAA